MSSDLLGLTGNGRELAPGAEHRRSGTAESGFSPGLPLPRESELEFLSPWPCDVICLASEVLGGFFRTGRPS